jgi:uncharacterized membrane protein YqaE (UPF0057 family)
VGSSPVGADLHVWPNFLLTVLGGLPGARHALWLVACDKER